MSLGLKIFWIVLGVLILAVVIVTVVLILVFRSRLRDWWNKAKKDIQALKYPCLTNGECGTIHKLGSEYVCDPTLDQCRLRAYIDGYCQVSDDCLAITPHCTFAETGRGVMCMQLPYHAHDVFGDPTDGRTCSATTQLNELFNFCQTRLGFACKSTNECHDGACVAGTCQQLPPFAVCVTTGTYGGAQCLDGFYCAKDKYYPASVERCQPDGIAPGADGAYCLKDTDCNNRDCYFATPSDPVGRCASHIGLVGMPCRHSADCAPSLACGTAGTCQFLDPAAQTDVANCPFKQYTNVSSTVAGCIGASFPVPCSRPEMCTSNCNQGEVSSLVIGVLGANQTWSALYPQGSTASDTSGFFNAGFTGASGNWVLRPNHTLMVSPFESALSRITAYPPIGFLRVPPGAHPGPPAAPPLDPRACQPLVGGAVLLSSFANAYNSTCTFLVDYDPDSPRDASVRVLLATPDIHSGQTVAFTLGSLTDLYSYCLYNNNQQTDSPTPPTQVFTYRNFHGYVDSASWTITAGDGGLNLPPLWQIPDHQLVPPPRLPSRTEYRAYYDSVLKFSEAQPAAQRPPGQPYVHFFFFPSPGETVISSRFSVLPTQVGGGVTTLVGLYEVETNTAGVKTRRLVISNASLYTAPKTDAKNNRYACNTADATIYAELRTAYDDPGSNNAVFISVYSFTLVDFDVAWPFLGMLSGPPSTVHDTAGLCRVNFTTTTSAEATLEVLGEDVDSVPGFLANRAYPIFTPRAYTRVQAASSTRTAEWNNIFDNKTPTLLDSDFTVLGAAGGSAIVGLLLLYKVDEGPSQGNYTIILTMRFGDVMPTSRYSLPNLDSSTLPYATRTRMFTFYLTPDPEETGGGTVRPYDELPRPAFNTPPIALAPYESAQITSWVTPGDDPTGIYATHHSRTPWGSEVFTASLIPEAFEAPVRFFRMPITDATKLSIAGADEVWVWGRKGESLVAVPLFFDSFGTVTATMGSGPFAGEKWLSPTALTCPPSSVVSEITLGMEVWYDLEPFSKYQVHQWGIQNTVGWKNMLPPDIILNPLPMIGRMCETQGYQDGILLRVRPYSFASTDAMYQDTALPAGILHNLNLSSDIFPGILEGMAVALVSRMGGYDYKQAIPLIGVGGIQAMKGRGAALHPSAAGIFNNPATKLFIWASSEGSSTPLLPAGYRLLPCPLNPRASPVGPATYPLTCPDIDIAASELRNSRKPLPIMIMWQTGANVMEPRLYDLRMTRDPANGKYEITVVSDSLVQMNGGMATTPSSPGMSGGPILVYSPCSS